MFLYYCGSLVDLDLHMSALWSDMLWSDMLSVKRVMVPLYSLSAVA